MLPISAIRCRSHSTRVSSVGIDRFFRSKVDATEEKELGTRFNVKASQTSSQTGSPTGRKARRQRSRLAHQPANQSEQRVGRPAHSAKPPLSQAAKQPSSHSAEQPSSQAAKQPSSQAAKQPSSQAAEQGFPTILWFEDGVHSEFDGDRSARALSVCPLGPPSRTRRTGSLPVMPLSVKKHSSGEEDMWEHKLSECQIRGWRAVSAAGLRGQGLRKRTVFHRHRYACMLDCSLTLSVSFVFGQAFLRVLSAQCALRFEPAMCSPLFHARTDMALRQRASRPW